MQRGQQCFYLVVRRIPRKIGWRWRVDFGECLETSLNTRGGRQRDVIGILEMRRSAIREGGLPVESCLTTEAKRERDTKCRP